MCKIINNEHKIKEIKYNKFCFNQNVHYIFNIFVIKVLNNINNPTKLNQTTT